MRNTVVMATIDLIDRMMHVHFQESAINQECNNNNKKFIKISMICNTNVSFDKILKIIFRYEKYTSLDLQGGVQRKINIFFSILCYFTHQHNF